MKIIDGTDTRLGRLASYAAKEALKGEDIVILNSEKVIITGKRENIIEDFYKKRKLTGSGQKGPKISKRADFIVKRAIRGMLPDFRKGRGKKAFKKIKCYIGFPEEFKDKKIEKISFKKAFKYIKLEDIK